MVISLQLKKMTLSSLNCGARSCKKSRHFRIILWEFTCQVCANATSKKQKCKTNWQGYFSTRQTGETLCCCYSIEEGGRFQKLVSFLHKDAFTCDVVRCKDVHMVVPFAYLLSSCSKFELVKKEGTGSHKKMIQSNSMHLYFPFFKAKNVLCILLRNVKICKI